MKIDFDTYKEILDTLTRNKSRSMLTGFGVFWGIFMLVSLMGGGQGLREKISSEFEGFATNSAMIWAQPTTKAYQGFRKGRTWTMDLTDVERLKHMMPELDVVSPMVFAMNGSSSIVYKDKRISCNVKGVNADFVRVEEPQMGYGRFINDMDVAQNRKVCVIGKKLYQHLFSAGTDPCGQLVRVDSMYYTVVGVNYNNGNMSFNGNAEESVILPISYMQKAYNMGVNVSLVCITGKKGVSMSKLSPKIRSIVARRHSVDPTDEKAVTVFNTEVLFGMMDSLFQGVHYLIWLVGIGTLLAGAIGVSNIMLVTVRERTTEIGIRRAIGATPRNILSQIITESIVMTLVAGMSGIVFSVAVLQLLEMANTTDGMVEAHFQVGFWSAVGALCMLSALGVLAGLPPALRALAIKPVDAMRDE